jgi:hypothetical protein
MLYIPSTLIVPEMRQANNLLASQSLFLGIASNLVVAYLKLDNRSSLCNHSTSQ